MNYLFRIGEFKRDDGQVTRAINVPESGELVWFHLGNDDYVPAIWITPPAAPHHRYPTVLMMGEVNSTCHYSRFYRGLKPPGPKE
jgi:hypothetical protein